MNYKTFTKLQLVQTVEYKNDCIAKIEEKLKKSRVTKIKLYKKLKTEIKNLNEKYNEFLEVIKAEIDINARKNKELDDYFLLLHDDLIKMKNELEKDNKYRNYFDKYEVLNNFIHN